MNEVKFERQEEPQEEREFLKSVDGEIIGYVDEKAKDHEVRELLREGWYMQSEGTNPIIRVTVVKDLPNIDARHVVKFTHVRSEMWIREEDGTIFNLSRERLSYEVEQLVRAGWYFRTEPGRFGTVTMTEA